MLDGPHEVAIVGPPGAQRESLANLARHHPTAVVVVAGGSDEAIPLLAGRGPVDGRAAACVCRHHVCAAPVTDVEGLRVALG
ncbi:hypothetical protein [Nocardioides sp. B-3]|uniref:hypothetical protein n=1 Tax=Nocardioides sp. B-3 TaxID=2895565 RepID=UPI002152FF9D|nr:hypothetical protein [Nocardioides sp. B-3]UUZ60282.1 hypothetical protein LP418_04955 [Nocardioides sp. B-3]